jgi:uncharacterized protein (TIGR03067 family)
MSATVRLFLTLAALSLLPIAVRSADADDLAQDRKQIQGTWEVVAYDLDGVKLPADIRQKMSVTIQAEKLTISPKIVAQRFQMLKGDKWQADVKFKAEDEKADDAKYRLDFVKKQKVIELTQDIGSGQVRKITALYILDGDNLTICIPLADHKLPKKIPDAPAAGLVRLVLKKAAPKEQP